MKLKLLILAAIIITGTRVFAQTVDPIITINDNPVTYSMHICSDGEYYYTINGGVAKDGKISKFKLNGEFVASYPISQDMRSIMYNKKDKSLYINIKGKDIFKIVDIANGTIQLVHSGIYENEQATLAIDPQGKNFYSLDNGDLSIFSVKTGKLIKKLSGLKCGSKGMKGSTTVAVDGNYLYTWDADTRTVYAYSKDGAFKKSFVLKSGNLGHSLSFAYGLIFVAKSDMGKPSTWYGYKLNVK
jgi:DNA-binding beta-propeller fold protein YncE